jgi:hypothetical protein
MAGACVGAAAGLQAEIRIDTTMSTLIDENTLRAFMAFSFPFSS